jgi:hypothetical protein
MIISCGQRTDIVQYYSEWLLNRFREGNVLVRNPVYPQAVTRYELDPSVVDCVLFCSKNYQPFLPHFHAVADRFHTYYYYTITAYGKDIEPRVPSIDESIDTLIALSELAGKERVVWRYSPIFLNEKYTKERVLETFRYIAGKVAPYIDRCIFEFVDLYEKLKVNMPELKHVSVKDQIDLMKGMGEISAQYGLYLQNCATDEDDSMYGIHPAGCIDLSVIGKANGIVFRPMKAKGMRPHCHCAETHDIGAYNTCPNGCRYCYATWNFREAERRVQSHDPSSPLLYGHINKDDVIHYGRQESWLIQNEQLSLF